MLEEFVTTVTELVPELMSYSQRAQLILGLRARVSSIYCLITLKRHLADVFGDAPSFLDDCLRSYFPPDDMKAVLEHHRNLGHFEEKGILGLEEVGDFCHPNCKGSVLKHIQRKILQKCFPDWTSGNGGRASGHIIHHLPTGLTPLWTFIIIFGSVDIWCLYLSSALSDSSFVISDSQEGSFPVVTDTKVPWSDEETLHLLDIWGKDSVQRALKGCLKNRHIFTQIAQKMAERGYMRTVEQCQTRIKRLKKGFRQNSKGNFKVERKFYAQLEQVLGSPAASAVPEVTYDVEEVVDEDESQDADEDLQFIGQTGTRSVPWTDLESLTLINTWGEDKIQRELRGIYRTGDLFSIISSKLTAQGFSRTPEQCQARLKRLKNSFRHCYQNKYVLKGQDRVECKFYNELGRFLVKDFPSVPQLNEIQAEQEDSDFPAYSHEDIESAVGVQEDRKKVPWSDKETIILLESWGDPQVQQCLRRYPHNGHIFTEISEKLSANGYTRSAEQCHTRIKRLKASYRHCQDNIASGTVRVDFKFYDLLEQILDKQPSTSSAVITDSIEISEDSNDESGTERAPSSWLDEETLALIDIWGDEDVQKALRGFVHNGHVYADISERMHDLGFSKTSEQCRWKVKSLRVNFRQSYDRKKCGRKVDYKFYNQLEQILGQEAVSIDEFDQLLCLPVGGDGVNTAWTEQETVALIEIWAADDVQHSLKTCIRNGHIFADISEKLASMGFLRTAEQCHSRIKRLKKTYRTGGRPAVFRYFHFLAPVLGDESVFPSTSHHLVDLSRKMPWLDQETRTLLEIWGEDSVQLTLRGCLKNRHVFEYVSEKMSDRGFIRTSEQCYTRIKRLKHGFLHEKGEKQECKYFDQLVQIFGTKYVMNSDPLADDTAEVMGKTDIEHVGGFLLCQSTVKLWNLQDKVECKLCGLHLASMI
uniref:Myb-like domain-containing protein n=1 Tax=Amphiprion percula TaxID=161767 RepID=A0A3P8RX00_AMPPE